MERKTELNNTITFLLIFSFGVTARKIGENLFFSDFVIILYIIANVNTLLAINIQKLQVATVLIFVWLFCLLTSSITNLFIINGYTLLDLILSAGRLTMYFLMIIVIADKLNSEKEITRYLGIFRNVVIAHVSCLLLSVVLFYLGINNLNQLYEVQTGEILNTGVLKVFIYPLYNRFCGLFEEPSQFAQFLCAYLITDLILRRKYKLKPMGFKMIILLLVGCFYIRSVASLVLVIMPLFYSIWKYELSGMILLKSLLATISIVVIVAVAPILIKLALELPRVEELISGRDKSTSVRFFSYAAPLKVLRETDHMFLGTGLGYSPDYFASREFKSQIIPISVFIEGGVLTFISFLILVGYTIIRGSLVLSAVFIAYLFSNGYFITPILFIIFVVFIIESKNAQRIPKGSNVGFVS
ncbi:hypothetical protein [Roseivirga pacifica]|uniref:hypothetical protein n=1 Tax=Roseivirga pacifica TaxID=1267423 RepID=UPI00227B0892|nr:hypothetical protein [Roseivirga pacifica]